MEPCLISLLTLMNMAMNNMRGKPCHPLVFTIVPSLARAECSLNTWLIQLNNHLTKNGCFQDRQALWIANTEGRWLHTQGLHVCMHIFMCADALGCADACGCDRGQLWVTFLKYSPLCFLRQGLSLAWSSLSRLYWLASEHKDPFVSVFLALRLRALATAPWYYHI